MRSENIVTLRVKVKSEGWGKDSDPELGPGSGKGPREGRRVGTGGAGSGLIDHLEKWKPGPHDGLAGRGGHEELDQRLRCWWRHAHVCGTCAARCASGGRACRESIKGEQAGRYPEAGVSTPALAMTVEMVRQA